MNARSWPALTALAAGALCAGLAAAPAGAAATASAVSCFDAPGDATCDGVSPYQLGKNGFGYCAQSAYEVPRGHPDIPSYTDPDTGEFYTVFLMYSSLCHTNWAIVQADGTSIVPAAFSAKVRRHAETGVSYLMEHAADPGAVADPGEYADAVSPMVYAPSAPAQACLSLPPYTGASDQTVCTSYH